MIRVDVLVAGGGPSGLIAAADLAERHSVALIDSTTVEKSSKYFVTTPNRLTKNGLSECLRYKTDSLIIGTFLGGHATGRGDIAVVDETLLSQVLFERCRLNGVALVEKCKLLNLSWTNSHIDVETTKESYRARMVVDATGGFSSLASTFRLHRLHGFYSVYGALLRGIDLHTSSVILAYIDHMGEPPPILEVVPCDANSAYCAVFAYSKRLTSPETLASTFADHCLRNPFFHLTTHTETVAAKSGSITIGTKAKRQLPGVISIGEAGLIQPPLLGTAFNEVLEYSHRICSWVSGLLESSEAVPRLPNFRYPLSKRMQDRIQLQIIKILIGGNVESFDRLVRFMNRLPPEFIYNFCSNELTWAQLARAARFPFYSSYAGRRPGSY